MSTYDEGILPNLILGLNGRHGDAGHGHPGSIEDAAHAYVEGVLTDLVRGEVNSESHYGRERLIHQEYQLGGGGPGMWAHFVFSMDDPDQLDHAYIEYIEMGGGATIRLGDFAAGTLYEALNRSPQEDA